MRYIPPVNEDEKLFVSRIRDLVRQASARHCMRFSPFMNLREKSLAEGVVLSEKSIMTCFYGGDETSERVMLGISQNELMPWDFPITRLDFTFNGTLSHRDVLGALLGLSIAREKTGDIFIAPNAFCIFLCDNIADFVKENLFEVGRERVKFSQTYLDIPLSRRFEERTDTIASKRIDNVVSAIANISRNKAAEMIGRGFASINHLQVTKPDFETEEGDMLSLRGSGKYIIDGLSDLSRKGRIILKYRKYI